MSSATDEQPIQEEEEEGGGGGGKEEEEEEDNKKENVDTTTTKKEQAVIEERSTPSTLAEDDDVDYKDIDLHDAERFIAFTDAVVAIALTLLILPLMENANEFFGEEEGNNVGEWFNENRHRLGGFALSFFVVSLFWIQHDSTFQHVFCICK